MNWEPWTGCYPVSDGCTYCYFYGPCAKRYGQNKVEKTDKFDWPIRKNAKGEYTIKGNKILATCFATDFFLPEADEWRTDICQPGNNGLVYNAAVDIDTEYYNLFVVGNEIINESCFIIEKDRALTISEGVLPDISELFASLSPDMIAKIKTFPSLFTSVNRDFGRTDDEHLALYGFVTGVNIQKNGIKIYFQGFCSIPQQRLNTIASKLEIQCASLSNELNRTHWTIKRVNLIKELRSAGFNVPVPHNVESP